MGGWYHRHNGHESEQAPGDSEAQGSLECCSPRGREESDTTERLSKIPSEGTKLPPNGHTMGKMIKPGALTLKADWQGLIPKLPIGGLEPEGEIHLVPKQKCEQ